MVYITGDTHTYGLFDILDHPECRAGNTFIVAGDCGIVWDYYARFDPSRDIINGFAKSGAKLLFVDGNHENFDKLERLPEVTMYGGPVGFVSDEIFHLKRGNLYEVEGKKILAMGGATSISKNGVDWWPREMPSEEEIRLLYTTVRQNRRVDYVVTHTCPLSVWGDIIVRCGLKVLDIDRSLEEHLEYVRQRLSFRKWYFGHFHMDKVIGKKFRAIYNDILRME